MRMPALVTGRTVVRELVQDDLPAVRRLLAEELAGVDVGSDPLPDAEVADWLDWTVASYVQLARLRQPPYGERAVVRGIDGQFVGLVGYAPALAPFEQLPALAGGVARPNAPFTPEVGLYYAMLPEHRRQGYAAEAAAVLVRYAFDRLALRRIVATTNYDNLASQAVMRRLGMRIERNPYLEPHWLQVVGVLER